LDAVHPGLLDCLISPNVDPDQRRRLDPVELLAKFEWKAVFLLAQKSELELSSL